MNTEVSCDECSKNINEIMQIKDFTLDIFTKSSLNHVSLGNPLQEHLLIFKSQKITFIRYTDDKYLPTRQAVKYRRNFTYYEHTV